MFVFKSVEILQKHLRDIKNKKTGFIPTMGALHEGHLSLIRTSKSRGYYTVCSIYVNPTQFNNADDLIKYPVTLENDIKILALSGCDVLFLPSSDEMYGNKVEAWHYDFGSITANYEGSARPGHFDGVITIVTKLFDSVKPHAVFFGQKDLQQCMVISHLAEDRYPGLSFHIVETKREPDGLAMSSRNVRLSEEARAVAVNLSKALFSMKDALLNGADAEVALREAKETYLSHPMLKLEYLDVIDKYTMTPVRSNVQPERTAVIIACWCADVRLIDNVLLTD